MPALHGEVHIGMTTPEPAPTTARKLARYLLEREAAEVTDEGSRAAAMERALARVSETLRRFVGDDGYSALLARALVRAEADHSLVKSLRRVDPSGLRLDVIAAVEGHGPVSAGAAVESLLTAIVEILSDFIGADMVRNLLNQDDQPKADGRRTQ
jgi:hypothetical protein